MKTILAGVAAGSMMLLGATAGFAADLGSPRMSIKDDGGDFRGRPCGGQRFAGFYGGMNLGLVDLNSKWEETSNDFGGSFLGDPIKSTHSGLSVGLGAGYNWVRCNFLMGIEGDYNFANIGGGTDGVPPNTVAVWPTPLGGINVREGIKDYATLRARTGWIFNDTLLYATYGLAWGNTSHQLIDYNHYDSGMQNPAFSGWKTGFVIGGGFEHAFTDRISLKGEGLYMDLGKRDYSLTDHATPPAPLDTYTFSNRQSVTTFRLGFDVKLGDWSRHCDDCAAPLK